VQSSKPKYSNFVRTLTILALLSWLGACASKAPIQAPDLRPTTEKPEILTVAVLDFANNSIGPASATAGLGQVFADQIFERLSGQPGIVVVDRESIEKILEELSLSSQGLTEAEGRLRLGKLLGAQYLILGGYMAIGSAIRIDARVVEVERGTVEGIAQEGSLSDRQQLTSTLSEKVANKLFDKASAFAAQMPKSSQGHFQRGLFFERKNKLDEALKHYQKALALDSENQGARDRMEVLLLKEIE